MKKVLLALIVFAASFSCAQDTLTGLQLAWKTQAGSGTSLTDSSSNANTGTVTGATWTTTSISPLTNALVYASGSTHSDAASQTGVNFDFNQAFSISAWVRPTSVGQAAIVSTLDTASNFKGYELALTNPGCTGGSSFDCLQFYLVNNFGTHDILVFQPVSLSVNTLYHIVVTYDGSHTAAGVKFYVNGTLQTGNTVTHDTLSTFTTTNTKKPRVGARQDASTPVVGSVGPVYIYNTVLNASSVTNLFNNPYTLATSASSYSITGPVALLNSSVQTYTVTPSGAYSGTVTLSDGGSGGTFTPTSLTWSSSSAAQTFTYSNASSGSYTLTGSSSPSITNGTLGVTVRPATAFYVSSSGSDSNNGTSTGTPWQTMSKVNAATFLPGDSILFNGGNTFTGPLSQTLVGTQTAPIVIGSYGTGNANITGPSGSYATCITNWTTDFVTSGACDAIDLPNSEYYQITNLNLTATAWSGTFPTLTVNNCGAAIYSRSTKTSGTPWRGVTIGPNVTATNFCFGVMLLSMSSSSAVGWANLSVHDNTFNHLLFYAFGIFGYGQGNGGAVNINKGVYVGHNVITDLPGNPNGVSSIPAKNSQAITIASTTGATVEANYINEGGYTAGTAIGTGGCSIVATNSRNVLFQFNEITATAMVHDHDGCSLDFDQDVQNSVARYNLSYNNPGPFFQMGSFGGLFTTNNAIYGNVSINDIRGYSTGTAMGSITLWGGGANSSVFFNNTIYLDTTGTVGTPSAIGYELGTTSGLTFANNIFKVTGGLPISQGNATWGASNQYIGNTYDSSGGSLLFYSGVTTLAGFRAVGSGYENLNGINYGVVGSANFSNLAGFSAPTGGFIAAANGISGMHNFDLLSGSAAIGSGVDPAFLGSLIGPVDFHRSLTMRTGAVDAGAVSSVQQSSGSGAGSIVIQ